MSDQDSKQPEASPYEPSEVAHQPQVQLRRRFPPVWVCIAVSLLVILIAVIRIFTVFGDHAIVNILTLVLGFLALNVVAFWYFFRSAYPGWIRLGTALSVVAAVALFFSLFRVNDVSGDMVPTFRFRYEPAPDELLETPIPQGAAKGVEVTSDHDFPQFLGPDRNGVIANRNLADWIAPPREIWRKSIGAGWSGFAAVNGYAFTLEQRGEEELTTCYEISTGDFVWGTPVRHRHMTTMGGVGPRSTPTINEGLVYSLGAGGDLHCLDGSTGAVVWHRNLLAEFNVPEGEDQKAIAWGRAGSPLIVGDRVIVPAGGPLTGPHVSLAAYDKKTGESLWQAGRQQVSYASPVYAKLGGREQIVSVNQDKVAGYALESGDELWSFFWPGKSNADANVSQPFLLGDGRILFSKGYGGGAALIEFADENVDAYQERWRNPKVLKTKFTNLVVVGDYAFGLSDGILECVDLADGRKKWKKGRYGHGQILAVGDDLLVLSEDGELIRGPATHERWQETFKQPVLNGKTWNNLCVYQNFLLIRNAEEAVCLELEFAP